MRKSGSTLYMLIRPGPISYDSSVGTYRDIDIKASFIHTLHIVQGWWPDGSCSGIFKKIYVIHVLKLTLFVKHCRLDSIFWGNPPNQSLS